MLTPISTNQPYSMVEPDIDMASLMKQLKFETHSEGQHDYLHSKSRFNVPCCGRRWGKSQATGHRATYKLFIPNTYNWIVGPTYKLGEKEFRVVFNDFKKLGLLKHCRKNYAPSQGAMRIETPWNSIIEVVSAEKPDTLLGEGLDHAIMSEAATHSRSTWEQFIEPSLSDKLGSADFPSTPRGYNWYHGMHQLGQVPNQNMYASWTFPTWANTARYPGGINNAELQRIKATVTPGYWDQEYGAKFTSFQGAIYPEFDEAHNVISHTYNPDWQNFLAFDYGFANPFCCLDIQVDPYDRAYVWREYYVRHMSTYEHGQALAQRPQPSDYHIDGMFGDPSGANEAATLALMLGYVCGEQVDWKFGIEEIKRMLPANEANGFKPRLYFDKSCTNVIRQVEQLHVKERARVTINTQDLNEYVGDGNIQHKVDDHAADALRYFIGQYFVIGAGTHLADVYDAPHAGSESEDFFRLHSGVVLDSQVRF